MKKYAAILFVLMMMLSGCSAPAESSQTTQSETVQETQKTGERALIVYFSPANNDTTDAVSSATPRVDDVSSVAYLAQLISEVVPADVVPIVTQQAYPTGYEATADQAKKEADDEIKPAFTLDADPSDYDTIFVGYPIWWYQMPMVMETFFETYDLSGKTIIPFNTHAGSSDGGTYDDIAKLEPNATVKEGLPVSGESADDAKESVKEWLAGLGY